MVDCKSGLPFFTPFFSRKPKLVVVHDIQRGIVTREAPFPISLITYLGERSMSVFYRNEKFIAVSESTREKLSGMGIPPENIVIIPNGVGDHFQNYNYRKENFPHVVYLGRLVKYKRIDLLLKPMKMVRKEMPDVKLTIAGSGSSELNLKRATNALDLGESVTFTGYINEGEKAKVLQSAWVFVTPSSNEGWGITTIEANACCTPCIAYEVPGLRDSIRDGETGLLVKEDGNVAALARAIIKILKDGKLRKSLSKNAFKWSKKFNWNKSAEEFEKLIKWIANEC